MAEERTLHPIAAFRYEHDLTQEELAEEWSEFRGWIVHRVQISLWETGRRNMSPSILAQWNAFTTAFNSR